MIDALAAERNAPGITIEGVLVHQCPFKDEKDVGFVKITYTPARLIAEIHSLRAWLDTFADVKISHEELTTRIQAEFSKAMQTTMVEVVTTWRTAEMTVTCRA